MASKCCPQRQHEYEHQCSKRGKRDIRFHYRQRIPLNLRNFQINLPVAPETERIRAELNAQAASINPMAATELHMLQMNLLSKKEHLLQQMRFVRARAEEVQSVRRAIERETLADTESILHRLRGAEALKLSLLKHDMDQLQHDVDEIDGFATTLKADSLSGVGKGGDVINNSAIPVSTKAGIWRCVRKQNGLPISLLRPA